MLPRQKAKGTPREHHHLGTMTAPTCHRQAGGPSPPHQTSLNVQKEGPWVQSGPRKTAPVRSFCERLGRRNVHKSQTSSLRAQHPNPATVGRLSSWDSQLPRALAARLRIEKLSSKQAGSLGTSQPQNHELVFNEVLEKPHCFSSTTRENPLSGCALATSAESLCCPVHLDAGFYCECLPSPENLGTNAMSALGSGVDLFWKVSNICESCAGFHSP